MKQLIQELSSGVTSLIEVPIPTPTDNEVLIKTEFSLVSKGTEKMLVNFGKANLMDKALQQPERVKEVVSKMKTDGIKPTVEAVFRKLNKPIPLGYCQAGRIVEVGEGVNEFKIGDRVISNGNHAEYVSVSKNLVAAVPDSVSLEEATFTPIGAIGLQGLRLANPQFGETVVVIGLGLVGQITVQLLKANGCNVIGFDVDSNKLNQAEKLGILAVNSNNQNPVKFIESATRLQGADAVIITASTDSNDVIKQAAGMSRKRGRIILVGVIGLDIDRNDFYEKELTFQVSCSYGPGRYDTEYEIHGIDYPLPFVRWTEKRNFEAILEAIKHRSLNVKPLISETVRLKNFQKIYNNINESKSIASILEYPDNQTEIESNRILSLKEPVIKGEKSSIAIIGAGNFTQAIVLPILKQTEASIKYLVSSGGVSSTVLAKKFDIKNSSTSANKVLKDPDVNGVIITTRHHLHAELTIDSLRAGKQVFVEKPLALSQGELDEILSAIKDTGKTVTVGFNRRFSPYIEKMKNLIGENPAPMSIVTTMNAGFIPPESWVHDLKIGGGRIIGEACHHIDLISYLTGSKVEWVSMQAMGVNPLGNSDNVTIQLKYKNGSIGVLNYFSNGHRSVPKEKIEVFYQGKNLILDNFRHLTGYGFKSSRFTNTIIKAKLDKGHQKQFKLLIERWKKGGKSLIPLDEIINTTKSSFAAIQSMKEKSWIRIEH